MPPRQSTYARISLTGDSFCFLILGDCLMGCGWGLVSLLLGIKTYNFFGA